METKPLKSRVLGLALATGAMFSIQSLQAYPDEAIAHGNSCSACHGPNDASHPLADGRKVTGVLAVSQFSRLTDLGTQLDGKTRGFLRTFDGVAGQTVTLSVDVAASAELVNPTAALQLKRLEKQGQKNSATNFLDWTDANAGGSGWTKQGTTDPYFTKEIGAATGTFSFDLGLKPTTPVDFYDLEFAIAGKDDNGDQFYQDEHYYLAVVATELLTDRAVTWSAALTAAGYVLEVTDDLAGPWTAYTGETAIIEGTNVALMKTSEGGKKFFRIQKP
jgi:hypothetical protein